MKLPTPLLVTGFLLAGPAAAGAGIDLPQPVVVGKLVALEVVDNGAPLAGVMVSVTYNPRSRVSRDEPVGMTSARGVLRWRPRAAGLVRIEARSAGEGGARTFTRDVGVRFHRVPPTGLATLVLAAGILASGLVAGLRRPGASRAR